jgi:hypothetical protein
MSRNSQGLGTVQQSTLTIASGGAPIPIACECGPGQPPDHRGAPYRNVVTTPSTGAPPWNAQPV